MRALRLLTIGLLILMTALSVACAKRRPNRQVFSAGYGYCTNDKLGSFDVTLTVSDQAGLYEMTIVTVKAAAYGGQYVRAALANQDLQYEELVNATLIKDNKTLYSGYVTPEQLDAYTVIVIAPYKGGTDFLNAESEDDEAICQIPSRDPEATGSTTTF